MKISVSWKLFLFVGICATFSFGNTSHTFTYNPPADSHPQRVNLAGSFNDWSTTRTPMQKAANGSFAVTLSLPDGVYEYKFVINGNRWVTDPDSDKALENAGDPNHNSAVLFGPDLRNAPPPLPNHINVSGISFDPQDDADVNVFETGRARFRVRVQAGDVQRVSVAVEGREPQVLHRLATERGQDIYGGIISYNPANRTYFLLFADGTDAACFDARGAFDARNHGRHLEALYLPKGPTFQTPEWAKHAIWYQIFPERFRNGDPANDPPHTQRWQSKWFSVLPGETPGMENFYKGAGNVWQRRYGGDVQGMIWALPYLKNLGVNAIYLNPMFESPSLHKYDTTDYRHIDEHFGFKGDIEKLRGETDDPATWQWTRSDKLFLQFVAKAHAMGFHVILDGVFNHVGRDFWAFQDVLKNGKKSKYAGWFDIRDWGPPIKYIAWDTGDVPTSHGAMPIFKKDPVLGLVHGPREHVLNIARRWLAPDGDPSRGVDGFRLDVAEGVPHPFWVVFRKVVKSVKPDAYISGEIWSMAQPWLQGDQFDAVMNYPFAVDMQEFFVNQKMAIAPSAFNDRLNKLIYAYPLQIALDQMNLLDSHDTDRFASMFVNPDLPYDGADRIEDNGPNYSDAKPDATQIKRMEQALVTQFTFVGAPMIYYGDEAGMWSPDDPSNRQPMIWKDLEPYDDPRVKFNQQLFDWYQKLISIRKSEPALQTGFYRPILLDNSRDIFVYARDLGNQHVYVAVNRSDKPARITVQLDPSVRDVSDLLSARGGDRPVVNGKLAVRLEAYESAILLAK